MPKINIKLFIISQVLFLLLSFPALAAQPSGFSLSEPPAGIGNVSLAGIVINITNWVLGFVTLIAVLMLIWGGIQYLTSGGDEGAVASAKNTITYAILGLVIVGIAYAVVAVVVNVFIQGNFG